MKAVMISIKPKWVAMIASGEKKIEVRKTAPKIETPFKCYIYCTKTGDRLYYNGINVFDISKELTGKVVGEFICDEIKPAYEWTEEDFKATCVSKEEYIEYAGKSRSNQIYGWHISNLKIYAKPKELSEFRKLGKVYHDIRENEKGYLTFLDGYIEGEPLTCPPQSWFYVEVEE